VSKKIAYGNERFYPINNEAKFVIKLIGRPSFTRKQLQLCKENGWKINLIENQNDELFEK
jgi:hypothetical protein